MMNNISCQNYGIISAYQQLTCFAIGQRKVFWPLVYRAWYIYTRYC